MGAARGQNTEPAHDGATLADPTGGFLARAFQHAAIAMAILDPDDRVREVNPAMTRLLGRTRDELLWRHLDQVAGPGLVGFLSADHLSRAEIDIVGHDGAEVSVLATVVALRDDADVHYGTLLQLEPLSFRKHEERFRLAFQNAATGMVIASPDDIYLDVNDAFCSIVGRSRAELLGHTPSLVTHPDDLNATEGRRQQMAAGGMDAYVVEKRFLLPDRQVIIGLLTASSVRDDAGNLLYKIAQVQDITVLKLEENARLEREEQLRALVERAPAALYRLELGPQGRFMFAGPRFQSMTGLRIEESGATLADYLRRIHPDDVAAVRDADLAASKTGETLDLDYRIKSDDGSWIWVHDRSWPSRNVEGIITAWHGVLLDTSEHHMMQESLRESEARFRSVFEASGVGMALVTLDAHLTHTNPAIDRLLGYQPGELEGVFADSLIHPDDLAEHVRVRRQLEAGAFGTYQLEQRCRRKDGTYVWVHVSLTLMLDESGHPHAIIVQVQDISARKEAEVALLESESRFRALVQNDPDVVVIVNPAFVVTYVSPSAREAFGRPLEEWPHHLEVGLRHVHPDDRERIRDLYLQANASPAEPAATEARIRHGDGDWRWFQITIANRLDTPGIGGYLLNLRNITERKQAELATSAALAARQTAIEEMERLNLSKSRFLSTISHEFRTPLTAITGYSEYLIEHASHPSQVAEDATIINREAHRLNRMIGDLLLIDGVDAGRLSLTVDDVNLNDLVTRVTRDIRPIVATHVLVLDLEPDLLPVSGDYDRLGQALTNLLGNAVKYSPYGGTITVTTCNRQDAAVVSVRDEGIGIAAEDLDRIFERFERVETGIAGRVAGTGLGLSIVREIAHMHSGEIAVESTPGQGACFSLALPYARQASHGASESLSGDSAGTTGPSTTIGVCVLSGDRASRQHHHLLRIAHPSGNGVRPAAPERR